MLSLFHVCNSVNYVQSDKVKVIFKHFLREQSSTSWWYLVVDGRRKLSHPSDHQLISESLAKTQDLTIDEQLKAGVRVFDLRYERVYNAATMGYDLRCRLNQKNIPPKAQTFGGMLIQTYHRQLKAAMVSAVPL